MLSADTVRSIETRLARGQSVPTVAKTVGVSRTTVLRILQGRAPGSAARAVREAKRGAPLKPSKARIGRCLLCRRLVSLPCLACSVQPYAPTHSPADDAGEELQVGFEENHQEMVILKDIPQYFTDHSTTLMLKNRQ